MYRINRIGPNPLIDVDKVTIRNAVANFNLIDHAIDNYGVVSSNAVVPEDANEDSVIYSADPSLATLMAVGLGCQVLGTDTKRNFVFGVSGSIHYACSDLSDLTLQLIMGRLDADPDIAANVVMTNPKFIPFNLNIRGNVVKADFNHQVVNQSETGLPATEYPIALAWHLQNRSGGNLALEGLEVRIQIHRYFQDLFTHDPTR